MEKSDADFSIDTIVKIFLCVIVVCLLSLGALMAKNSGLDSSRRDKIIIATQGIDVEKYSHIATKNFARWNNALQSRDAKKVTELYFPDATFLPTCSSEFLNEDCETEQYFKYFLKKNPIGKIVSEKVQVLSPSIYLHSGLYNFKIGEVGDRHTIEARFTFLWILDEQGVWKISHHHSSIKPKA